MTAGRGWWFLLASTGTARNRKILRREKALFDERCPRLCTAGFLHGNRWKIAGLAERPDSHKKVGKTKPTGDSRREATGTSEVGSHRITKDENSLAGWTSPLKRIWRRETLGSSILSVQSRKTSADTDFRGEARKSRRDLVGNDRTRVHEFFECVDGSCRWCASRVCDGSRGPSRR
jgi:hypothetical protein